MSLDSISFDHSAAIDGLILRSFEAFKPPERLTVSEWAVRHRRLSPEGSAFTGRFRLEAAPYQREPMEAVNDPEVQSVVMMWASQTGKTEIINNIVGFFISEEPSPMLVLQPTLDMAETWSKDRLAPMVRDTAILTELVADSKARDSGNTVLHKRFTGGHITVAGANSPTSLASRPIRVVLCDEVDRYPQSAGAEGDPISLAQKRSDTFFNSVHVTTSTPTIKGVSRVEAEFDLTDQRCWFCPCPHCGEHQLLQWSQVTWDKDEEGKHLPETARLVCSKCKADISDKQRQQMVNQGEWRPTSEFTGKRGYHLNGLASLFPPRKGYKTRLHQAVSQFLDSKHRGTESLKAWTNTFLAETWEEQGETVNASPLLARCEPYAGKVPQDAVVLTAGVDCQDDRLEVEIVAWGLGEECWGIEYRTIYGAITNPATWQQLDQWLSQSWEHESGVQLRIASAMIDTGYQSKIVYDFCKPREVRRIHAIKGVAGQNRPVVSRPNRGNSAKVALFSLGVDSAKELLYSRLKIEDSGAGYCHFPIGQGYDDEYFEQLTAEKAVTKVRNGVKSRVWQKTRPRNEALDVRVYALAAFVNLNANLDQLAKSLKAKSVDESKPKEQPSKDPMQVVRVRPPRRGFVNAWKT